MALTATFFCITEFAGAATPTEGESIPDSAVAVTPFTADTPFSSGQGINVLVPANSLFVATTSISIVECAAPEGVIPTTPDACDGNTHNGPSLFPNSDGSINYLAATGTLYPVYATPDPLLGDSSTGPTCGNTPATECILYIGDNQNDFTQNHVWSQPFFVAANVGDTGANPGDGSQPKVPAVPSATASTVVAAPTTATADGADQSTVTVTLLGTGNVPVPGKTVTLGQGSGHSIVSPTAPSVTDANGQAVFTVTDTTTESVTYTATDVTDSVAVTEKPTVDFQPPAIDAAHSSVTASLSSVPTGGSTTITVTLRDQGANAQPVAGQTVTLVGAATKGAGSAVIVGSADPNVTDSSGVASFTVTDPTSEQITFTATDTTPSQPIVLPQQSVVTFGSLTVSASASTVTATSPALVGNIGTQVVVTLLTANGSPLTGKSVALALSPSSTSTTAVIVGSPQMTDAEGAATFTVTDSSPESVTFVADDSSDTTPITGTATVAFQKSMPSAAKSTVSAGSATSIADKESQTPVTVTINDQFGQPESGKTVTLAATGSAESHPVAVGGSGAPGVTNDAGEVEFEVDDTVAEVATFTATDSTDSLTVTQTASVTYSAGMADPLAGSSTVVASVANPPSDGQTPTMLTVTVTDAFGNPVQGETVSLGGLPSGNAAVIKTVSAVTDATGAATFSATDATAEVVTFQATDVTDASTALTSEAVVTFGNPPIPPPVASFSSVVAAPTTVPADGASTSMISVLLYNGSGDVVPGKVVTLTAATGASKIATINGTTTNTGTALFTVADSTAESVTYTAEDTTDSVTLGDTPVTIRFTAVTGITTTPTTVTGITTTPTTVGSSTTPTTIAVSTAAVSSSSGAGSGGSDGSDGSDGFRRFGRLGLPRLYRVVFAHTLDGGRRRGDDGRRDGWPPSGQGGVVRGPVSHMRRGSWTAVALMVGAWGFLAAVPAGAAQPPALKVTTAPFHDRERINVSVGPNHYFTPYSHVNILECADPGGKRAKLPTSVASCDGNTIQGPTVLVNKNGSFSESGYEIYALPNKAQLGELSDNRPACNEKERCVLYVGQDQERFTAPKVFSSPFTVRNAKAHS